MRTVHCPSCNTKLAIRVDVQGQKVKCGNCGDKFVIAQESDDHIAAPPRPLIYIEAPPQERHKRRPFATFLNYVVHIAITCATLYAAYYVISQRRIVEQQPVVSRTEPAQVPEAPKDIPKKREVSPPRHNEPPPLPEPARVVVPARDPFPGLPSRITLPGSDKSNQISLFGIDADAHLTLISQHPSLSLVDDVLHWHSEEGHQIAVAGIAIRDGEVQFRWLGDVPQEAETALRNSLIKLDHQGREHVFALREPVQLAAPVFDLTKPAQRIICKVEHSPEPTDVWVDLTSVHQFPPHRHEGKKLLGMRMGDSAMLWWTGAAAAGTKLALVRIGNVAVLKLDSRYKLPSGDEEPMSIPRGNRKLKQLNDLLRDAHSARNAIGELRSYRSRLLGETQRSTGATVNGVWVENPVLVARKAAALGELAATDKQIKRAEDLIAREPTIERELRELERVSEVARSLHGRTIISYRFFTVVDDYEVDLVVAE